MGEFSTSLLQLSHAQNAVAERGISTTAWLWKASWTPKGGPPASGKSLMKTFWERTAFREAPNMVRSCWAYCLPLVRNFMPPSDKNNVGRGEESVTPMSNATHFPVYTTRYTESSCVH